MTGAKLYPIMSSPANVEMWRRGRLRRQKWWEGLSAQELCQGAGEAGDRPQQNGVYIKIETDNAAVSGAGEI